MLLNVSRYHYSQWGGADGLSLKISIGKKFVSEALYRTPIRAHSYFNNSGETFCCETTFIGFSGPLSYIGPSCSILVKAIIQKDFCVSMVVSKAQSGAGQWGRKFTHCPFC